MLSHVICQMLMLNNFCFHVYAQNTLFIGENGNGFFDILSSTTHAYDKRVHRAGSHLKTTNCFYNWRNEPTPLPAPRCRHPPHCPRPWRCCGLIPAMPSTGSCAAPPGPPPWGCGAAGRTCAWLGGAGPGCLCVCICRSRFPFCPKDAGQSVHLCGRSW